jgi:hypothetical protein
LVRRGGRRPRRSTMALAASSDVGPETVAAATTLHVEKSPTRRPAGTTRRRARRRSTRFSGCRITASPCADTRWSGQARSACPKRSRPARATLHARRRTIREHILGVGTAMRGRVIDSDVVNEPFVFNDLLIFRQWRTEQHFGSNCGLIRRTAKSLLHGAIVSLSKSAFGPNAGWKRNPLRVRSIRDIFGEYNGVLASVWHGRAADTCKCHAYDAGTVFA